MCADPFGTLQIDGVGPEFRLHDTEALLDLPSFAVYHQDTADAFPFQVRAYGIKAIVFFLMVYDVLVDIRDILPACLPGVRHPVMAYEPVRVVLAFAPAGGAAAVDDLPGTADLAVTDTAEVIPVLDGERYNHPLLKCLRSFFLLGRGDI